MKPFLRAGAQWVQLVIRNARDQKYSQTIALSLNIILLFCLTKENHIQIPSDEKIVCIRTVFIGPRCPWGPIYVSGPMSVTTRLVADSG